MIAIVVIINILIASLGLVLCGYIIRLRYSLCQFTAALVAAEQACHQTLATAPEWFDIQQANLKQLRLQYQGLQLQAAQLQQVLTVLRFSSRLLLLLSPRLYPRSVKFLSLR